MFVFFSFIRFFILMCIIVELNIGSFLVDLCNKSFKEIGLFLCGLRYVLLNFFFGKDNLFEMVFL